MKTKLYKNGQLVGKFLTARDIYDYIEKVEDKRITCLCKLKEMGYKYKLVVGGK
jgi:hypothetical protein